MAYAADSVTDSPVLRYSNTAVTFHWVTVLLVVAQACLGFGFELAGRTPLGGELFTWHKTLGALILITTLARLAYRLKNPPPPYGPDMPRWEQVAGTWNHRIFYVLLILMPLSGLTAVSARAKGATTPLVGGIPLPVIPGVSESVGDAAGDLHVLLVFVLILLILLHAAAALKHQFFDHMPSAGRMPPFQPPDGRPVVVGQGPD
jgi:cytochrome b561